MQIRHVNEITEAIISAAIEVHRVLGPGLLESAYDPCLCREFDLRRICYQRQLALPIQYKGVQLATAYRLDFLIEDRVVLDIKAVEQLLPVHEAQVLTYMRLGHWQIGLLLNFNVPLLKDGIRRLVNNLPE